MSLAQTLEALAKRPLSVDELKMVGEFQQQFGIDDDDPLNVVLAIMVRSQLILETAPSLLQQKVDHTIELHRMAMREQAVLIAKELITDLGAEMRAQTNAGRKAWLIYAGSFAGGMVFMSVLFVLIQRLMP